MKCSTTDDVLAQVCLLSAAEGFEEVAAKLRSLVDHVKHPKKRATALKRQLIKGMHMMSNTKFALDHYNGKSVPLPTRAHG